MKRPDLDTLACVNAECQLFRHAGASNLVIRKVYGHDCIRLRSYWIPGSWNLRLSYTWLGKEMISLSPAG